MEPAAVNRLYTAEQVRQLVADAWAEARQDLYRELEQQPDERSERDCLAQLRNFTKAQGRVNVRIE